MEPLLWWCIAAVAAVISVLCSVAEGALRSFSADRLEQVLRDSTRRQVYSRIDGYIFSASVINAVADMACVAAVALALSSETSWPAIVGVGVSLICVLVFGELVPRVFGTAYADRLLGGMLSFVAVLEKVFVFVVWPLSKFSALLLSWLHGNDPEERRVSELLDELRTAAIEGEHEGVLDEQEADMIERVIEYRDVEVREIMTPRTAMVGVKLEATMAEVVELAVERGHSRMPVYEDTRDQVRGVLYVKDVLHYLHDNTGHWRERSASDMIRPPYFVPESKSVGDLLEEFRARKVHIAIVLDEYGGTAGLVTIEDIVEEIVGEIEDEYDQACHSEPAVREVSPGVAEVDASLHVDEVQERLELVLPDDGDYETLGGLVLCRMGKIPTVGESIVCGNVRLTVLEADDRHVQRVRVEYPFGAS